MARNDELSQSIDDISEKAPDDLSTLSYGNLSKEALIDIVMNKSKKTENSEIFHHFLWFSQLNLFSQSVGFEKF